MKSVVELITEGHALMTPAEARTRLTLARNSKGEAVSPYDPKATCFCTVGALHRVGGPDTPIDVKHEAIALLTQAIKLVTNTRINVVEFNDDKAVDHGLYTQMWDKALELANAPAS